MDQSNIPKSDPSILLLNEIEILLAQTRLMELYLKQAQATAANETARMNERHQAELATLHAALAANENIAPIVAPDPELTQRLETIESELGANQLLLDQRDRDLAAVQADAARLRGEIAELEMARHQTQATAFESARARESLQTELAALRKELESKQHEFTQRQRDAQQIEQVLRQQLTQLQSELNDKHSWSQNATSEIEQSRNEIAALRARVAEIEARRQEAQSGAAHELAQTRARFELELGQLRAALAARAEADQQSQTALAQIEGNLNSEILTLKNQLEQKQQQLETRDGEWRQAQSELAALNRRMADLDDVNRQAAAEKDAFEKAKQSYENEVAELHHHIAAKERELTQRYEAVTAVELALHGKIQALQQEVAQSHNERANQESELNGARDEIAKLAAHIRELESAREQAEATGKRFVEETRQRVEDELNRLHSSLAQKEYALNERENAYNALEDRLGAETQQLRNLLEEQRESSEVAKTELTLAQSNNAVLQDESRAHERERQQAEENWQRSGVIQKELQDRLQGRSEELQAVKSAADQLREQLDDKMNELQLELAQKQLLADSRGIEIGDLRNNLNQLAEQQAQVELGQRQSAALLRDAEQRHAAHQEEIAALNEAHGHQYQALESQLAQEQTSANDLRLQIQELERLASKRETEIKEKSANLDSARGQASGLQTRLTELESELGKHQVAAGETDQARSALATELASLRQELQQKSWALAQQQASVENLALAHREQIHKLEGQLTEQRGSATAHMAEVDRLGAETQQLRNLLEEQRESSEVAKTELTLAQSNNAVLQDESRAHERERQHAEENWQRSGVIQKELQDRLQGRSEELQAVKSAADQLREQLDDKMNELQLELAQKQLLADSRGIEIGDLRNNLNQLAEQQAQVELGQRQSAALLRDAEQRHAAHQEEIAALNEAHGHQYQALESQLAQEQTSANDLRLQIQELESQSSQRETELKEKNQSLDSASVQASGLQTRLVELESQLAQERASTNHLRLQIQEVERLASERETALDEKSSSLDSTRAQASADQTRLHELESQLKKDQADAGEIDQAHSALASEIASLRQELQRKTWALAQQQAAVENLAPAHREQIHKLEGQLNEQRGSAAAHMGELENAHAQAATLRRRVEELETALRHTEVAALSRAEQMRQEHAARDQELTTALQQKRSEVEEHGAAQTRQEQSLHAEIDRLVREVQERNQILQNRNDELVRVKAEMDTIHERFAQLELSASQSDAAAQNESERMRTEFQVQLALLQAELSQKEWALEERHAVASGTEQESRQEIETLRKQLAEQARLREQDADGLVMVDAELSPAQRDRAAKLQEIIETARTNPRDTLPDSHQRRWRTAFAWKRRWRG